VDRTNTTDGRTNTDSDDADTDSQGDFVSLASQQPSSRSHHHHDILITAASSSNYRSIHLTRWLRPSDNHNTASTTTPQNWLAPLDNHERATNHGFHWRMISPRAEIPAAHDRPHQRL